MASARARVGFAWASFCQLVRRPSGKNEEHPLLGVTFPDRESNQGRGCESAESYPLDHQRKDVPSRSAFAGLFAREKGLVLLPSQSVTSPSTEQAYLGGFFFFYFWTLTSGAAPESMKTAPQRRGRLLPPFPVGHQDGRVVKALDLRSNGHVSAWVRAPLLVEGFRHSLHRRLLFSSATHSVYTALPPERTLFRLENLPACSRCWSSIPTPSLKPYWPAGACAAFGRELWSGASGLGFLTGFQTGTGDALTGPAWTACLTYSSGQVVVTTPL